MALLSQFQRMPLNANNYVKPRVTDLESGDLNGYSGPVDNSKVNGQIASFDKLWSGYNLNPTWSGAVAQNRGDASSILSSTRAPNPATPAPRPANPTVNSAGLTLSQQLAMLTGQQRPQAQPAPPAVPAPQAQPAVEPPMSAPAPAVPAPQQRAAMLQRQIPRTFEQDFNSFARPAPQAPAASSRPSSPALARLRAMIGQR